MTEKKTTEKRVRPVRRGVNFKAQVSAAQKRGGLKGVHFSRWMCSDVTCNHDVIDRIGTTVCREFATYGENGNEGVEIRLEAFRIEGGVWEASARVDMHPDKQFKTSHAAMRHIEKQVREAFAQLTREDL